MQKLIDAAEELLDDRSEDYLHADDREMLREALGDGDDVDALTEALKELLDNRHKEYLHQDDRGMIAEALDSVR